MNCYPLRNTESTGKIKKPMQTLNNEEFVRERYDFYLTDELNHCYRLHAKQPHRMNDYLAYDIHCPKCGGMLTPAGAPIDYNELGLYTCKNCGKR